MFRGLVRWRAVSWLLMGGLLCPIATIFYQALFANGEGLGHLWRSGLPTYIVNSIGLMGGTVVLSLLFGLPAAWLMTMYRFPGQRLLRWMLCLPLAVPPYLVAYIYTDLLDYAGPLQRWLRHLFGWGNAGDYGFPSIRSLGGACLVLALVLYPYIYLLVRRALLEQSANLRYSARLLHHSPNRVFWRISFPLARPAIAVGAALVAMESLGDFGTVSYFAQSTLTTAIYDAWLGYGDLSAAARMSALMLLLIFFIVLMAYYSRRRQRIYQKSMGQEREDSPPLSGLMKWLAQGYCWGLIVLAMGIPCLMLIIWSWRYVAHSWSMAFFHSSLNSLMVSSLAAGVTLLVALVLVFSSRLGADKSSPVLLRLAGLGYVVPGTILAIGLLIPLAAFNHGINRLVSWVNLPSSGLLLSGMLFALVIAYCLRFSAVMIGRVESSMSRIPPSLDGVGRTLGSSPSQLLKRVHLPLLRRGIVIGTLLVFIESMKELNASLLLRPFNFETLATYVFTFTSDEQLEQAALPAMMLVLVGLLPVIWLNAVLENKR
ncbi:iron ABC transporter permease [Brenneria alni]|uniref:Iron ABC transporter permease n=1 Tax=Brenneria alni TaxID=71656 RepID=A0A421DK36_9GAMM|nr:iron ABC transporter permease [Brenneria alni]RLM19531.1 iron ABC transporter permease [Brenneria alni]